MQRWTTVYAWKVCGSPDDQCSKGWVSFGFCYCCGSFTVSSVSFLFLQGYPVEAGVLNGFFNVLLHPHLSISPVYLHYRWDLSMLLPTCLASQVMGIGEALCCLCLGWPCTLMVLGMGLPQFSCTLPLWCQINFVSLDSWIHFMGEGFFAFHLPHQWVPSDGISIRFQDREYFLPLPRGYSHFISDEYVLAPTINLHQC